MGRRNLRVEIPRNAEELLKLAKRIIEKHLADGVASELNGVDMAGFTDQHTIADLAHEKADQKKRESEQEREQRDLALGLAKIQKSTEKGTILYLVTSIRDTLQGKFRGEEHKLGAWGFNIETSPRTKKPDPPAA